MEDQRPRLYFRTEPETKKKIQMYALAHDTSVQQILESYVNILLELDIGPEEALAAIRQAKEKPGES
jgi:hypothetical protein